MKDVDSHKRELEKRPVTDDDVERALGNLKALGTADMLIECMDKFVCLHDGMSSQPLLKAAIMKEWRKHVIIGFAHRRPSPTDGLLIASTGSAGISATCSRGRPSRS